MSAAHTPGPWTYTPAGCYVDDAGKPTSPVREFNINPVGVVLRVAPLTVNKAEANARLIAAAPAMAAALDTILFAVTRDADNNDGKVDRVAVAQLIRDTMAAAGVAL